MLRLALFSILFLGTCSQSKSQTTLTFEELVELATQDPLPPGLREKLQRVLTEPVVNNQASLNGARPKAPVVRGLGPVLRVAEWNINRGENETAIKLALADPESFQAAARSRAVLHKKTLKRAAEQSSALNGADLIVLDEVDNGVNRTGYHDVARDLAQALKMNYVYAVEFIELNRIYLGAKGKDAVDLARSRAAREVFGVNPKAYKGQEGSALLSRYPIRAARVIRLPEQYDWYHNEIEAISVLERARSWSAEQLFGEQIQRQVRRGGRMALVVDIEVPQSPTGLITVVCPHLEDYSPPGGRREQMHYLLCNTADLANPVILAGDLNTMGHDGTPLTIKRTLLKVLTDYKFWLREAFFLVFPLPGVSYILYPVNYLKNFHDPTALNVPLFAANAEEPMLSDVRRFRFADGRNFDFSGNPESSYRHRGRTLADSNQRALKGFSPTFRFDRTWHGLVGEYKLDWFFIKPPVTPSATGSAHITKWSPHFGRTMHELNIALGDRISDHAPISLELPLNELQARKGP